MTDTIKLECGIYLQQDNMQALLYIRKYNIAGKCIYVQAN